MNYYVVLYDGDFYPELRYAYSGLSKFYSYGVFGTFIQVGNLSYKEGIAINAGLLIIGLLLQLAIGNANLNLLAYPVNVILLIAYFIMLIITHIFSKKVYFFRQLSAFQVVIPSVVSVALFIVFMGLLPQFQSNVEIFGIIGRLGFMQMLSAWYFVLIFAWFIFILGMVVIRRISSFRLKKDIPFILNHCGLLIALLCGIMGSADNHSLKLVHNPWQTAVYIGIWMMIAGAVCLFIFTPKRKKDEK